MIAKLARALPSNRYIEIRPDRGEGLTATLMEERPSGDQGDRVISRSVAMSDKSFEFLTSIMVGVDAPILMEGDAAEPSVLTAEDLEAVAYVRDMVAANPMAGCQDAISKRHTKMITAFELAVAKIKIAAAELEKEGRK